MRLIVVLFLGCCVSIDFEHHKCVGVLDALVSGVLDHPFIMACCLGDCINSLKKCLALFRFDRSYAPQNSHVISPFTKNRRACYPMSTLPAVLCELYCLHRCNKTTALFPLWAKRELIGSRVLCYKNHNRKNGSRHAHPSRDHSAIRKFAALVSQPPNSDRSVIGNT